MVHNEYEHERKNDGHGDEASDGQALYDVIARYPGLASRVSHLMAWWNLAALPLLWALPRAGVLALLLAAALSAFCCAVFRAFCIASKRGG